MFPSEAWIKALAAAAEKDPAARRELATWSGGGVVLVCEEDDLWDETVCFYLEPGPTGFREVTAIESPLDREAAFEVAAPYSVWKQILTGRAEPAQLVAKGALRVKGDREVIVAKAKVSRNFFHLLKQVPAAFPEE